MKTSPFKFNLLLAGVVLLLGASAAHAATIVISSRDPAGVGFNDPTPVAPVGGNTGTTLGEQRFIVYRKVADLWEAALQSNVTITVSAGWEALSCTASSAVLGSAGAWNIWRDAPNLSPGTWYPQALANKLAGVNLSDGTPDDGTGYGNVDIKTQFNVNLGNTGCLDGRRFYLGLDGNAGSNVNFMTTLLHELGHGLGFSVLTVQTSTGFRLNAAGTAFVSTGGVPSIWERYMFDNTAQKSWLAMTSAERQASAINPLGVAWTGPLAVAGAAQTLLDGSPSLKITVPVPGVTGFYEYGRAVFGPPAAFQASFGAVAKLTAGNLGCAPLTGADAAAANGKVVIIDRGGCTFKTKALNAQNAGAVGMLLANNAAGAAPGLADDATITTPITITTVSITQAAGTTLKAALDQLPFYGSRSRAARMVSDLSYDPSRPAGKDLLGRPLLYTPNPLIGGSSVSHWDVSAFPNLLMEPNISADLTNILVPPKDLTVPLLKDLGW